MQIGADAVLGCEKDLELFGIRHSNSNSIPLFLDCHSIQLVDRNECATVAHGYLSAHVSLRALLSLRSCFACFDGVVNVDIENNINSFTKYASDMNMSQKGRCR